jgi:glutamate formiminotransferase
VLECVVNVSEGRDEGALGALRAAAGDALLDFHADPHHHRSVFTLAGDGLEDAVRALAREAVTRLDLDAHQGVHPRIGVVDVVPFVPVAGSSMDEALAARGSFARWAGAELALPCFLYGPERSLPEIRRGAFESIAPDTGPPRPHRTAGASAVGARTVLIAYNLWLAAADVTTAKTIAASLRSRSVRALGLQVGEQAQVSCNLVEPMLVGPAEVYDRVAAVAAVTRAELVGLAPLEVVRAVPRTRWRELDLSEERTIESRLRR